MNKLFQNRNDEEIHGGIYKKYKSTLLISRVGFDVSNFLIPITVHAIPLKILS